jgi:hypothetical protein
MFKSGSRRQFFAGSLASGLGAALFTSLVVENAQASDEKMIPLWKQYYNGSMGIFTGLRDTQAGLIEREMKTALDRIKKGGAIYSQITAGHFPTEETALDRIGNPGVLAFLERNAKEDVYNKLDPNDMIITNTINLNNINAMKRGIRVVGVTVNYYPFSETPPEEGYQIEYEGKILHIEDTVNVTVYSQTPWYNGLVRDPNLNFAIIPGGGFAQAAVYWMTAAELTGLRSLKKRESGSGWAKSYIDKCIEKLLMAGQDRPKFEVVGKKLADLVLRGAKWWVFGASHALVSDAVGVANGPRITRPYKADQVKEGDIVLIGAYTSNHPEEIAAARESRNKGAYVLAITPFSTDGDASGERLYKEVDVAFNNYSPESWGVVPVKGRERKICPTTGVIGDIIMWLIVAEWTDVMARRGELPYFYKGFFMKNGREYNNMIKPYYDARGW